MVGVARGPGKTTCKKCSANIGPKALKIKTSFGSYHVKCWKPPRPFEVSEFQGYNQLDEAGKESFANTVKKWRETFDKKDEQIQKVNTKSATKHRKVDMGDHNALKIVEGFDGFNSIPTLISGFLEGEDLKGVAVVSKHWNLACKDDDVWKGACRMYPGAKVTKETLGKPWKDVYEALTSPKVTHGYCAECGRKGTYSLMFLRNLCQSEFKLNGKYDSVSCGKLKLYGLKESDVGKYGIRAAMGEVSYGVSLVFVSSFFGYSFDVTHSPGYCEIMHTNRVLFYSLVDVLRAERLKRNELAEETREKGAKEDVVKEDVAEGEDVIKEEVVKKDGAEGEDGGVEEQPKPKKRRRKM